MHTPDDLLSLIDAALPSGASSRLLVAFSGGLDSTVLLHALARGAPRRVRAVHINHGLHEQANAWQAHCEGEARRLGIEFQSCRVQVPPDAQDGVESAARRARYAALRECLAPGEALLTAHHADDQLETVLLALVRGSGVDGLAAMPVCRPFGQGWHLRPMLELTRAQLLAWAREQGLAWRDDPANLAKRFDRNQLRHSVIPTLRGRWPSVAQTAVRTARHLAEASDLLDALAQQDFSAVAVGGSLKVSTLNRLDPPRRRNVLRYWLKTHGVRRPSTRKLAGLEHDILHADADRNPWVRWDDIEVRRHRDLLYCVPRVSITDRARDWTWSTPLSLDELGTLRAEIVTGAGLKRSALPDRLIVRTRQGGERLRLPGRNHRHALKKLLQDANVLPWWRERLPLVYADNALIAVADLWIDADYAAGDREEGMRIVWEDRPRIEAVTEVAQTDAVAALKDE